MTTFWQLFKESVILQALLTLGIWGVLIYMVVAGRPVPDVMLGAANLVLGFYFGSKLAMQQGTVRVIHDRRDKEEE